MEIFFIGLSFLGILLFEKYGLKMKLPWVGKLCFLCGQLITIRSLPQDSLFKGFALLTYVYCMFWQDAKTYHISKKWVVPSVFLFLCLGFSQSLISSVSGAFLYGIPSLGMVWLKPEWIGQADVIYFFYFGALLGIERMMVACLMAIGIGFVWMLGTKKTILPFCSCLSIGVWIAYLRGYTILLSFADLLG